MKNKPVKKYFALSVWEKLAGQSFKNIFASGKKIVTVNYQISVEQEELKGKRLLFFSDLHYDYRYVNGDELVQKINQARPDWILFGGDLISYSAFIQPALELLRKLDPKPLKLAVLGNWDKRRRRWMPNAEWVKYFSSAGFQLLSNSSCSDKGIYFYGTDDCKAGIPDFNVSRDKTQFSVVIAHNPDSVIDFLPQNSFSSINLILCGHTHGGQVRIPFWGALKTSSRYWKKFEYGYFQNRQTGTRLIVSSGIGMTYKPWRFCCPPEIVLIDFV